MVLKFSELRSSSPQQFLPTFMSFNQRSTKLITVSCVDDAKYFHTHVEFFIKKQQENNKHFLPTRAISTVVELLLHYPILSLKSCTHYKSLQMFIFSHVVRYESAQRSRSKPTMIHCS